MSSLLRVAVGQAASTYDDPSANVATASMLLDEAVGQGARLLVLPESFLLGYDETLLASSAVPEPDDLPGLLLALARRTRTTGATLVLSTPLRRGPDVTMTMLVVHRDGRISAPYDKQHLDADEREFLVAGNHGASMIVEGHDLALAICYDSSFPEHARDAASAGADAYLVSAAFFPGSQRRRDTALAARALDNSMYVAAACASGPRHRPGVDGSTQQFTGGSTIWGPEGEPLAVLGTEDGVVVADLEPDRLAAVRRARTMHVDRRADLGPRTRLSS